MVITKIRTSNGSWGTPTPKTLEEIAKEITNVRNKTKSEKVYRHILNACQQNELATSVSDGLVKGCDTLPYLIFSTLFARSGVQSFQELTGLVLLSIENIGDTAETATIRSLVERMPQTLMAFSSVDRRSLKVVVRCRPYKRRMPVGEQDCLQFLAKAHETAADYFESQLRCKIRRECISLTSGCRMPFDPNVFYNPKAVTIAVADFCNSTLGKYLNAYSDGHGNCRNFHEEYLLKQQQTDFYTCMVKALEKTGNSGDSVADSEQLVIELATLCRKSAIPEELSVQRTLFYRQHNLDETIVRKIFRSVYLKRNAGSPCSQMTENERVAHSVHEFFQRRYQLRYNTMKALEEFRPRYGVQQQWLPLTEREIRRIAHEQMLDNGTAWTSDIEQYARSAIAPDYNPVHEFLAACGQWDRKKNYIEMMAGRVPCQFKEWPSLFHCWFLGMVATWMGKSRDYSNAVVPMLIGRQGVRKSTFCRILLPPSLREYYIDDIKLTNAEQVERMLTCMALVNIDEYNAKTSREQAKIKRILTERDVQVRRMRSDQYVMSQRMASFIATTNERQPLTDPTGNRRYLCVEVTGVIDSETPVNYQQMYAQAVWEIEHGAPYYMSHEDETIIEANNQHFLSASPADVLLNTYYEPAERNKDNFMLAVDILSELKQHTDSSNCLKMPQLLKALKVANFNYGALHGRRGWYAKKRISN